MAIGELLNTTDPQATLTNPTRPSTNQSASWSDWLGRPENKAMLVQAGIALLQPVSLGQSTLGHIGQAIGGGLEARDRNLAGTEAKTQATKTQSLEERKVGAQEVAAGAKYGAGGKGAVTDAQRYQRWQMFLQNMIQNDTSLMGKSPDEVAQLLQTPGPDGQTGIQKWFQIFSASEGEGAGLASPSPSLGAATQQGPVEGQTATNPQTGQKMIFQQGNWMPM